MHVLEAGEDNRPCVLLLHGFPEVAYSWHRIMPLIAQAGFYVLAPDQRGFGRTSGWDSSYDCDLSKFRMLNLVADMVALLRAINLKQVAAVVGHDFGSPVAAWCSLLRPDVFRAVVLMSAPFAGPPAPGVVSGESDPIHENLAKLMPSRKHYQVYFSSREANSDMLHSSQGLTAFLRAYYHYKSADWVGPKPAPLNAWTANELAKLPEYYVMPIDKSMPQTVAAAMPTRSEIDSCEWLPESVLAIYAAEFQRAGFQGGLNWYRCAIEYPRPEEMALFYGLSVGIPAAFIAGAADWGTVQRPGAMGRMRQVFTGMPPPQIVQRAGHWVQQEQPSLVADLLLDFLVRNRQ